MPAQSPTNAHSITSTADPISFIMPALLVIGLPGILVIIHIVMRTRVPPMPTLYHTLPHFRIIGSTQNIWAIPPTENRIAPLGLKLSVPGTSVRCNMPAIAGVAAARSEEHTSEL